MRLDSPPSAHTLDFAYDGSLLTSTTWSGPTTGTVSQTYNNKFLVVSRSVNAANTVAMVYDRDNLMTTAGALTINRNAQSGLVDGTTLGQVTTTQTYDSFKAPSLFTAKHNATILFSEQLTRDVLFRITKSVQSVLGAATTYDYTYDLRGRLKTVSTNGVVTATYNYDANGNRTQAIEGATTTNGSYDAQDRLTAYGTTTYTYTANGELATKTTSGQTTSYTYGAMGQLRAVALPNGTNITYVIDGRNRRVGKQVNGTLTKVWLYKDQLNPVAELDGSGNLVSRFVYGEQSHVPAYMVRGGVTYRFVTDTRGSVRLVVDVATGTVAQRLDYDAWGKITQDTNPGFQPFAFAGGHYDKDTGLTRFGARDYDAQVGRWTDKDPILFDGGSTNFYEYVKNDPINAIDTQGLFSLNDLLNSLPLSKKIKLGLCIVWKRSILKCLESGVNEYGCPGKYLTCDLKCRNKPDKGKNQWDRMNECLDLCKEQYKCCKQNKTYDSTKKKCICEEKTNP